MYSVTLPDVLLIMAGSLFVMGMATMAMGIFVLVARAMGRDMRTITAQTQRLAQKGLSEEIPGLVGNASSLMHAMQELVKTAAGIGIFLNVIGGGLIWAAYQLLQQINWPG